MRIAGKIAKIVKIRTRKNFVPHGISSLSELPVRRRKASAHLKFFLIACNTIELYVVRAAHRVKLCKLNQSGSTWTEFLSENVFFSFLSVVFLYTANRPDENELIQFFELS